MNPIAEEIESYLGSASITDEEYLAHYGNPQELLWLESNVYSAYTESQVGINFC